MLNNDELTLLAALARSGKQAKPDIPAVDQISKKVLSTINSYNLLDPNSFNEEFQRNYLICAAAFQICRRLKRGNAHKVTIKLLQWMADSPPRFSKLEVPRQLAAPALEIIIANKPSWALRYLNEVLEDCHESQLWGVTLTGILEIIDHAREHSKKEIILNKTIESEEFLNWLFDYTKTKAKSTSIESTQLLLEILAERLQSLNLTAHKSSVKSFCQALSIFFDRSPAHSLNCAFLAKIQPALPAIGQIGSVTLKRILSTAALTLSNASSLLSSNLTKEELLSIYDPFLSAAKVSTTAKREFLSAMENSLCCSQTEADTSSVDSIAVISDLLWDLFDEYDGSEANRAAVSIKNLMRQLRLTRTGTKEERVEYNPTVHSFIGEPRVGRVIIIKPGLAINRDSRQVHLKKALVASA